MPINVSTGVLKPNTHTVPLVKRSITTDFESVVASSNLAGNFFSVRPQTEPLFSRDWWIWSVSHCHTLTLSHSRPFRTTLFNTQVSNLVQDTYRFTTHNVCLSVCSCVPFCAERKGLVPKV